MPAPIHLLERAYQLINANQFQNAELVLDAVVRVDPQNVDAWKTYLMIHQSQNDLDWLKERILKTRELSETSKAELVNYHRFLTMQLNGEEEVTGRINSFHLVLHEEKEEPIVSKEKIIQFELIDVYDYPTKFSKNEIPPKPRSRSRRRTVYNPFAFDFIGSTIKAIARDPFARQITDGILNIIALVGDFVKDPKNAYDNFSKSPHFEKYTEVALLALFIFSVRLVIAHYFIGYILLGFFFVGGRWWLLNYGNRNKPTFSNQSRIYLHEDKTNLPFIKEAEIPQEQKTEREDAEKDLE